MAGSLQLFLVCLLKDVTGSLLQNFIFFFFSVPSGRKFQSLTFMLNGTMPENIAHSPPTLLPRCYMAGVK